MTLSRLPIDFPDSRELLHRSAIATTRALREANGHHAARGNTAGSDHDILPAVNSCPFPPLVHVVEPTLQNLPSAQSPDGSPAAPSSQYLPPSVRSATQLACPIRPMSFTHRADCLKRSIKTPYLTSGLDHRNPRRRPPFPRQGDHGYPQPSGSRTPPGPC